MPSTTYNTLTLGASGNSYIAPANGYFSLQATSSGTNSYVHLHTGKMSCVSSVNNASDSLGCIFPVIKGQSVIAYWYDITNAIFTFYYADGEV